VGRFERRRREPARRGLLIVAAAGVLTLVGLSSTGSHAAAAGSTLQVAPRGNGSVSVSPAPSGTGENPCAENSGQDSCSDSFPAGTTVTLTATPDSGSTFAGWSVAECPSGDACTVTLSDPLTTVVATFSPLTLSVRLSEDDVGDSHGSVTSSPAGIDCPNTCDAPFPPGTKVTLTAKADSGHAFRTWNPACTPSNAATCTMVVSDQPTWAGASFDDEEPPPLPTTIDVELRVERSGDGSGTVMGSSIGCGDTCSASYGFNSLASLTAQSDPGSTFGGWGGVCPASETTCAFPVGPITAIRAVFDRKPTVAA
jgi:hypothetical protein